MIVHHGPIGRLVKGHVLDVSLSGFTRALKDLDSQLYVKWNPKKLKGWGCWEIRRRPNRKTSVYRCSHQDVAYYSLEYVEYDTVHHVLDCAFLNYDAIRKLKEMDTYSKTHWIHDLERREEEHREKENAKAREALKYAIKQNKSAARDLYEMVRSGINPGRILTASDWTLK